VSWLTNVEDDGKVDWYGVKRATDWHTDSTYEDDPPILAILHAKEVPSSKGGTMFADMRAAHDALPRAMQDRLSTLVACMVAAPDPPARNSTALTRERPRRCITKCSDPP
jgi:taurine dioxygenase